MKTHWFLGLLLAVAVTPAVANPSKPSRPEGPHGDPEKRIERMTERLGLTKDQQQRLRGLMEKHWKEAQAIRQNENLSPEDRRAQMKTLRQQHRAEVASILTPEQKAKWEAARERIKEARPDKPERPGVERPKRPRAED